MGLLDLCEKYFTSRSLYEVLKLKKEASEKEIKKAYHNISLLVHPDRVPESEKLEATEKFKVLGKIHAILSDKNKRAVYDESGTVEEDDELTERNWKDYWGVIFKPITVEDIVKYEKDYIGSDMELTDLKKAYLEGKGDINFIMDHVPFSNAESEKRFTVIVKKWINNDEVPEFKIFTNEPKSKRDQRHAKQKREAREVEEIQQQKEKENGCQDLALMIRQKQADREGQLDSFIDGLAAKYGSQKTTRQSAAKRRSAGSEKPQKKKKNSK